MADNNTFYECKCEYGGVIVCKTCAEWMDKVDKTIEKHRVDEFIRVTKAKRWSKPNIKKRR